MGVSTNPAKKNLAMYYPSSTLLFIYIFSLFFSIFSIQACLIINRLPPQARCFAQSKNRYSTGICLDEIAALRKLLVYVVNDLPLPTAPPSKKYIYSIYCIFHLLNNHEATTTANELVEYSIVYGHFITV